MPVASEKPAEKSKSSDRPNDDTQDRDGGKDEPKPEGPSIWEWVVGAVGLILVLGAIGFLVYEAVVSKDRPPDVVVEVSGIDNVSTGYLVKLVVRNRGDQTASGVGVEGTSSATAPWSSRAGSVSRTCRPAQPEEAAFTSCTTRRPTR